MSVDAVAARREARKRKILENSSNRLTKILGQSDIPIRTDDNPADGNSASAAKNVEPTCNGAAFHDEPLIPNGLLNDMLNDDSSNIFTGELQPRTGIETQGSVSQDRSDHRVLWIIFHTLLGFIVRLMFQFNLGVLFADSLCMPFITMLVAKYMSDPDHIGEGHGASGQGFVRLALMMCGIPQTALDKVFRCQSIIMNVLFDFSLYFFSFTLAHELLSIFAPR